jgi:hypothetical protein
MSKANVQDLLVKGSSSQKVLLETKVGNGENLMYLITHFPVSFSPLALFQPVNCLFK